MPRAAPRFATAGKKPAPAISLGAVAAGVRNGRQGGARPRPWPPRRRSRCRRYRSDRLASRCNRPDRPACDLTSPTPTIPDQRQKEEIAKKIISRFTRIAALACAIAGLIAVTGCDTPADIYPPSTGGPTRGIEVHTPPVPLAPNVDGSGYVQASVGTPPHSRIPNKVRVEVARGGPPPITSLDGGRSCGRLLPGSFFLRVERNMRERPWRSVPRRITRCAVPTSTVTSVRVVSVGSSATSPTWSRTSITSSAAVPVS